MAVRHLKLLFSSIKIFQGIDPNSSYGLQAISIIIFSLVSHLALACDFFPVEFTARGRLNSILPRRREFERCANRRCSFYIVFSLLTLPFCVFLAHSSFLSVRDGGQNRNRGEKMSLILKKTKLLFSSLLGEIFHSYIPPKYS